MVSSSFEGVHRRDESLANHSVAQIVSRYNDASLDPADTSGSDLNSFAMTEEDHLAKYRLNRQKLESHGSIDRPGDNVLDEERDRGNERSEDHVSMVKARTPTRPGQSSHNPEISKATPQDDELSAQSEIPEDMQVILEPQGSTSSPQTPQTDTVQQESHQHSLESIWEASPEREGNFYNINGRVEHGVHMFAPPRYACPTPLAESTGPVQSAQSPKDIPAPFRKKDQPTNESVSLSNDPTSNDSDHDSLFDFKEERAATFQHTEGLRNAKASHRVRRRVAASRVKNTVGDDTSLDTYGTSPATLQERSQQAWKSRQKKNSSFRARNAKTANNVSFGGKDTVQYFNPHADAKTVVDEKSLGTMDLLEERSLNSEYTKTLESEVEDLIKDILLIGDPSISQPGRRKLKYKPEIKKRQVELKRKGEKSSMSRTEGEKVEPVSSTLSKSKRKGGARSKKTRDSSRKGSEKSENESQGNTNEDGGFLWDMVEGGVNVVSSAFGLAEEPEPTESISGTRNSSNSIPPSSMVSSEPASTGEQLTEAFGFAQDLIYAAVDGSNESTNNTESNSVDSTVNKLPTILENGILNRENITELALHAARSLHQSQGVEFDDSHALVIEKDVFMSTVEMKLPLGLIFLENDGGCFVTKVSPDGSASRCGGVEVGDQLAAINGLKSINTKVDDICRAIAKSSDPNTVVMMFIRYIGPFRPLRITKNSMSSSEMKTATNPANPSTKSPQRNGEKEAAKTSERSNSPKESKNRGFRLFGGGSKKAH